ncbi:MAG: choline dehydrogenase [Alphaproteobacteria bacterium]
MRSDYVIVGAGSAGCVLAGRLSEGGDATVTLIEAGGSDRSPLIRVPIGLLWVMQGGRYDWGFATTPQAGLGGRALRYPRGRVLGGSSSINGMTAIRGQAEDFEAWAAHGCEGWDFRSILPYFKKLESYPGGGDQYHGAFGPIGLADVSYRPPVANAVIAACVEAGIPRNDDFNGARQEGAGYYQNNMRRGLRESASVGYLRPAARRPNLTVLTRAQVVRINVEGDRACSVTIKQGGETKTIEAGREIILSAGAIQSPQLLLLSGVGPEDELKRHGIPVVRRLDGVGRNFHDHIDVPVIAQVSEGSALHSQYTPLRTLGHALRYAFLRTGPLAVVTSPVGIFTRSRAEVPTPDLQYHVALWGFLGHGAIKLKLDAVTAAVCPMRPTSRGTIRLASADPFAAPLIDPNYLATEDDRRTILDAIRVTRRITAQPAFKPFFEKELYPGPAKESDEDLMAFVRENADTVYHPVGTCRMGRADDPATVVTPDLRVNGIRSLRVVDASIMPRVVSGNTNLPVMMIAERAADLIRGSRSV